MASVYNRGSKDRPNWYARYKDLDGKWTAKPTGQPTKATAMIFAAEVEARVRRGMIGIPEPEPNKCDALSVAQLCERFLSDYIGPKIRKVGSYQQQRRSDYRSRIQPFPIAALALQKVRVVDVEKWRDELRANAYAPKTINESLGFLRLLFNWAIRQELLDGRNPCAEVAKLPTEPSQERYTLDEAHRLLAVPELPPMIAVALYTGMRRGEIAGLRWEDVRFDLGRIDVRRSYSGPTKTNKPRVVPLHRELAPILQAWRARGESPTGLIFPIHIAGVWRAATECDEQLADALRAVLTQAGCRADFLRPWHAFRHTFATLFLEQGGAVAALERILGHTTSGNQITAGYTHLDLPFLARELDRLTLTPPMLADVISITARRAIA